MDTGKIFEGSANVQEDQAKILFNYYKSAAQRIVAEEERIENEIAALESERNELENRISGLWVWFLTIILFFMYFIKKNSLQQNIDEIDGRIAEFRKMHSEIFRDYAVTKLGVAYVPVADRVKYEDKSFVVDYTGSTPESKIALSVPRHNDLLIETIGTLGNLAKEAPIVETSENVETVSTDDYSLSIQELNQNDYMGSLERSLRTVAYCMDDLDTTSVELPLVLDDSPELERLDEFATEKLPEGAVVVKVFDDAAYDAGIKKFEEINKLKASLSTETEQFEDVLKQLMSTIAMSVQNISALKVASIDKLVLDSNKLLYSLLKSPYNHYSPVLEFDEIERIRHEKFDFSNDIQGYEPFSLRPSSRMRFNAVTGQWTAEDGSTCANPFGVHQLYEEIVAPVVQNLMAENRIERLKIYNHIKDQKLSYLNKWHQDTDAFYRANRAQSVDLINLMQSTLTEYVAAYNTLVALQRTEQSMSASGSLEAGVVESSSNADETLAAFEMQSQEFQKVQTEFEDYIDRLKEDIDLRAEKFGHVEYYDARLRDGYSNEVATAADEVGDMEPRRRELATVNPLLGKTSQLPPQPDVADITFEHLAINLPAAAKSALEDMEAAEAAQSQAETEERNETVFVSQPEEATAEFSSPATPPPFNPDSLNNNNA